jgi:hypothetical protein
LKALRVKAQVRLSKLWFKKKLSDGKDKDNSCR